MKDSLLSRFFNNKIVVFIITTIQIIYLLVLYTLKTPQDQNKALVLVRKNIFLMFICGIILVLSLYNVFLSVISSITLIICITFNNNINYSPSPSSPSSPSSPIIESFKDKKEKFSNKFVSRALRLTNNPHIEEYKNVWKDGFNENKRTRRKENLKNIKRNNRENFSKSKTGKERFINTRKLNSSNSDDEPFINTKEILNDMINRIDYEYEDFNYLKKYISSRIEEIVDLLDLLEDDD
jgi:hypothetical protein